MRIIVPTELGCCEHKLRVNILLLVLGKLGSTGVAWSPQVHKEETAGSQIPPRSLNSLRMFLGTISLPEKEVYSANGAEE